MTTGREMDRWAAVNTLLQTYADAIDRADIVALVALFTEDGIWEHGPATALRGRREIREHLLHMFPRYHRTSHHVGPPVVSADPGDTSSLNSTAYFIAAHELTDGGRSTVYGRYVDDISEDREGLLFRRRQIIAHVTEGVDDSRFRFVDRQRA